jgi:Glycosyl hydrolase family 26
MKVSPAESAWEGTSRPAVPRFAGNLVRAQRMGCRLRQWLGKPYWARGAAPGSRRSALVVLVLVGLVMSQLTASSAPEGKVLFGVSVEGGADTGSLRMVQQAAGKAPGLVMTYEQFAVAPAFPAEFAAAVAGRGAFPEVTWEPWDPAAGLDQPAYRLATLSSGWHDGYLRRWAHEIKAYRGLVWLRFAHEMNGSWYPWSESTNGNRPGDYVHAWRHVHDVFDREGVQNVYWVWSPNVAPPGSADIAGLYPGDGYVDAVGVDGYNWGTAHPAESWKTFDQVFGGTLARLGELTNKPLYIAEVGSSGQGGDKAEWIRDFFASLARRPEVRGFTWFDQVKETDWRFASSPADRQAFAAGVASSRYQGALHE